MNPLFQMMMPNSPFNMLNQLKSNPSDFLAKRGINLPEGMNDPNDIIKHLMDTGKVSQAQYNNAMNMARMFRR